MELKYFNGRTVDEWLEILDYARARGWKERPKFKLGDEVLVKALVADPAAGMDGLVRIHIPAIARCPDGHWDYLIAPEDLRSTGSTDE